MLKYEVFVSSLMSSNTYLVYDDTSKNGMIIDCGGNETEVISFVKQHNLSVSHILLTHGHFDHTMALPAFLEAFRAKLCIHKDDLILLRDARYNLSAQFLGMPICFENEIDIILFDESCISFGEHTVKIIHTPGHTPGSICIQINTMIFSGDTLFDNSIGNTSFPFGNLDKELDSIKNKLFVLPENTLVCPGHGTVTTIGKEKQYNMYLR